MGDISSLGEGRHELGIEGGVELQREALRCKYGRAMDDCSWLARATFGYFYILVFIIDVQRLYSSTHVYRQVATASFELRRVAGAKCAVDVGSFWGT